jgi:hypothetical protein
MESVTDLSSQEELLQLRNDGKISEAEYQDLLAAISKSPVDGGGDAVNGRESATLREVPWQIWVVVALLVVEGLGNLLIMPQQPIALIWLGAKCLFILGLLKRWRWVFCLFVVIGGIHVLFFLLQAPLVALINLAMVVLALWSFRFYFPSLGENTNLLGVENKPPVRTCEDSAPRSGETRSERRSGKIAISLMLGGIALPILGFLVCFAISGGGEGDAIGGVCFLLCVLVEIPAFVFGVISWRDVLGKATVAAISALLVLILVFYVHQPDSATRDGSAHRLLEQIGAEGEAHGRQKK